MGKTPKVWVNLKSRCDKRVKKKKCLVLGHVYESVYLRELAGYRSGCDGHKSSLMNMCMTVCLACQLFVLQIFSCSQSE